jgi:flagellar assembly protein FliH
MISLSRLIKSRYSNPAPSEKKVISIKIMDNAIDSEDSKPAFSLTEVERDRILAQARLEAEQIVTRANEEARIIREQINNEQLSWEQEKAVLSEDAKAVGYERGLQEGHQQGYQEYNELIQSAHEVIEASKQDYHNHIESSERVILELGLKVAGKILGKKLSDTEEEYMSLVKRALKNARDYKDIQLHVHPSHYHFLLANKEELIAIFPKEIDFYIYPDDELAEDSCIIESDNGRIDASVDSQLEEIKQKLFEMLESEQ